MKEGGADGPERLVTAGACLYSQMKLLRASNRSQLPIKICVLQQRLFGIAADGKEMFSTTKQSPVAQGNAEQVYAQITDTIPDAVDPTRGNELQTEATARNTRIAQQIFNCPH